MESLVPIIFLAGWIGTWYFGWKIKNWKHRWMAVILPVIFPYIGLIIALLLDKKCPHCRSYISMAADVCSKCGRTIKTGKVDVDVKAVAGTDVKEPSVSGNGMTKIVYDPETHQYVKR